MNKPGTQRRGVHLWGEVSQGEPDLHLMVPDGKPILLARTARHVFGKVPPIDTLEQLVTPPPGYTVTLKHVTVSASSLKLAYKIHDPSGRDVHSEDEPDNQTDPRHLTITIARVDGELVATLDGMFLKEEHQGKDIARSVMGHMLRGFRKLGVERVELQAVDKGPVAWARYGATWSPAHAPFYIHRFEQFLRAEHHFPPESAKDTAAKARFAYDLPDLKIHGKPVGREFLLSKYCNFPNIQGGKFLDLDGYPRNRGYYGVITIDPADRGYQMALTATEKHMGAK